MGNGGGSSSVNKAVLVSSTGISVRVEQYYYCHHYLNRLKY